MSEALNSTILNAPIFVDVAIETRPDHLVLVQRKSAPRGWALPGGYVDSHETLVQAAFREAFEETGLKVRISEQLHTYSFMSDSGHCKGITTLFAGTASGFPVGSDDAEIARAFHYTNIPEVIPNHRQLIADYIMWRRTGERPRLEQVGIAAPGNLTAENADDQVIISRRKIFPLFRALK